MKVSTANLADACLRLGVEIGLPQHLRVLAPGMHCLGPVRPVIHVGSVDVFLEAIHSAEPGQVLLVDNQGRRDEGCIGDLIAIEAKSRGLAGIVIWGCHRDSSELIEIGLPLCSLGACPMGPRRLDAQPRAAPTWITIDDFLASIGDVVVADDDGVVIIPAKHYPEVATCAAEIRCLEEKQATEVKLGRALWEQLDLDSFVRNRSVSPGHTFREHLASRRGAIEV